MKLAIGDWYFFKYKREGESRGDRYLSLYSDGACVIREHKVYDVNNGSFYISNKAMFKLAALNNFLDKLKEMCSTDMNQKQ